jgi:Ala-tRNA(Pro) deacylase
MNTRDELEDYLNENKIHYTVYTLENKSFPPPAEFWDQNRLNRCKNLFFRDNHGKNHFFVVLDFDRELDISILKKHTGHNTLSFASPRRLKKFLDQEPGALSVLGLVNDTEGHIKVIIDKNLDNGRLLTFLPFDKSGFIALSFSELLKFLIHTGHPFETVRLYL